MFHSRILVPTSVKDVWMTIQHTNDNIINTSCTTLFDCNAVSLSVTSQRNWSKNQLLGLETSALSIVGGCHPCWNDHVTHVVEAFGNLTAWRWLHWIHPVLVRKNSTAVFVSQYYENGTSVFRKRFLQQNQRVTSPNLQVSGPVVPTASRLGSPPPQPDGGEMLLWDTHW